MSATLSKIGLLLVLSVGVYIAAWSINVQDTSYLFTYILLGVLGWAIAKGIGFDYFSFHYGLYTITAILFYNYFVVLNGEPFIGLGDDRSFWEFSKTFYRQDFDLTTRFGPGTYFFSIRYQSYLFVLAGYFKFLELLGLESLAVFHPIMLNVFVGVMSTALIFKVFPKLFPGLPINALFICTLFPSIMYEATTLMRDSWITFLFLLLIYVFKSNLKLIPKWVFLGFIVLVTFFFRPAHAGFFSVFLGVVIFLNSKSFYSKVALAGGIAIVAVVSLQSTFAQYLKLLDQASQLYQADTDRISSGSSIGRLLYESNNPVIFLLRPLVIFFSPIPPPILSQMRIDNLFLSIGSLIWYFMGALNIYHFLSVIRTGVRKLFEKEIFPIWVTLLVTLIMLSVTSKNPRHLVYLYPFVLANAMLIWKNNPKLRSPFLILICLGVFGAIGGYVIFKAFL